MQIITENKFVSRPEVMAPAGSMESFNAALSAGADAVYLGLPYFNARRPARNFSADELKSAISTAHAKKVKVFIALNIDLKSSELPLLSRVLQLIVDLQADAVIVKDWAVFYLIKKYYPSLEIHLSTQLGISNRAAAVKTAQLGAQRVVLAREVSLLELEKFRGTDLPEIEIFAQGSMCFSFSGKCLLSSWVGGRSANRGGCLAPCRVAYKDGVTQNTDACFSMKDLSVVKRLGELANFPLAALKIEGRLKNPGWVKEMVQAYRQALDGGDISEIELRLKQFSGRELTDGYLFTRESLTASQNHAYGVYAGKVISAENGTLTLDFSNKQPDTALRLFKNGFVGMIYDAPLCFPQNEQGNGVLATDLTIEADTLIYEVGINENTHSQSKIGQHGYDLKLESISEQSILLTVITDEGEEVQEIKIKQVKHADRGTQISYLPEKLQVKFYYGRALNKFILNEDFTISRSQLNNLPDSVGQAMAKLHNRFQLKSIKFNNPEITGEIRSVGFDRFKEQAKYKIDQLRLRAADLEQILAYQGKIAANGLIIDMIEQKDLPNIKLIAKKHPVTAALFPILFENNMEGEKELVKALYNSGIRSFEVNDLAHLEILAAYDGVNLSAGSGFSAYNYLAAEYIVKMGVESVQIPYELDLDTLQDLCNLSKVPLNLTLLARIPLFFSRAENTLFNDGKTFTDQLENTLRVVNYRDLHIFFSAEHFYAEPALGKNLKFNSIIADLGGEKDIPAKFAMLQKGECPVQSRPFNLERKMY